jgi:pilus assembly protein CpaC
MADQYQEGNSDGRLVTPFIATHAHRNDLARPDDGFAAAADPEALFLGRLHKVYGNGQAPKGVYKGSYGFITD